jgi:hypothetical protein
MLQSDFDEFIQTNRSKLKGRSDPERIKLFIEWCNKYGIEELIIRLSGESKSFFDKSYFLDFTTKGILLRKKSWSRKLVDTGYVAGMAPSPYMLVSDKLKLNDIPKKTLAQTRDINTQKKNPSNQYIPYTDIIDFVMTRGIQTLVTNMLGSTLRHNFLSFMTEENSYSFMLPVGKNGQFEKIHFWLSAIVPFDVTCL